MRCVWCGEVMDSLIVNFSDEDHRVIEHRCADCSFVMRGENGQATYSGFYRANSEQWRKCEEHPMKVIDGWLVCGRREENCVY